MLKHLTFAVLAVLALPDPAGAQPKFRADGPDAVAYGMNDGYPMCEGLKYVNDASCRVGAFSNYGKLFPSREIKAPATPSALTRAPQELQFTYQFNGKTRTVDDYLDTHPVTGFLLAQGDRILVERYQYGRTDKQPMTSFSMAKTVLGLLTGIALEQGVLRSIDDTVEAYVPELKGTEFGRTSIKALLQMASGIAFSEVYSDFTSDIYTLARLTLEQGDPAGALAAAKRFDKRLLPPGQAFSYSSLDSTVLGLVVARAIKRPIATYAAEMLWQPLGAEADASWNIDASGQEVTYAYYNAVLRDWARLGLMLAHGGNWNGKQIVPASWVAASTTPGPSPQYGYQTWISPYDKRKFYLSGLRGQYVLVDPMDKLVLVQTALGVGPQALPEMVELMPGARAKLKEGR